MSLLSIAQDVAVNVGIQPLASVLTNTDPSAIKMVTFSQATGDELARRADWSGLRKTVTIIGTGNNDNLALPADFSRLVPGLSVRASMGGIIRTGLSSDEWNGLTGTEGTPRYARLIGGAISFYPYLAYGDTAKVTYQSKNWAPTGPIWTNDGDVPLVPEAVMTQGTIWRWRRQLGQDFQDYLAEYEAMIVDYAKFDDGIRAP